MAGRSRPSRKQQADGTGQQGRRGPQGPRAAKIGVLLTGRRCGGRRGAAETRGRMSDDIKAALTAVVERLVQLATEEPPFRSHLLRLLDAVQAALKDTERRAEGGPDPDAPARESLPPEPPSSSPLAVEEEDLAKPPSALPMTSAVFLPPAEADAPMADPRQTSLPPREPITELDLSGVEAR
jgi:hypothetical protein